MWWIRCCWTRQFQMDGLNPELVQSEGVVERTGERTGCARPLISEWQPRYGPASRLMDDAPHVRHTTAARAEQHREKERENGSGRPPHPSALLPVARQKQKQKKTKEPDSISLTTTTITKLKEKETTTKQKTKDTHTHTHNHQPLASEIERETKKESVVNRITCTGISRSGTTPTQSTVIIHTRLLWCGRLGH